MPVKAKNYKALTGQGQGEVKNYTLAEMGDLCNGNLLINSDFRYGVINQKKQSSYNSVARLYGADSWYVFKNSTLEVYENYIKITLPNVLSEVGQVTDILVNTLDSLTFALKLRNDNTIYKVTFENISSTMPNTGNKMSKNIYGNVSVNLFNFGGELSVFLTSTTNTSIEVQYMKIEKGKYFTGMPIWNKTNELIKCMSRFQIIDYVGLNCFPDDISGGQFMGWSFPIEMAKEPSLTVKKIQTMYGQDIPVSNFKEFEAISTKGFYKLNFNSGSNVDKRSISAVIWADSYRYA